MASIKIKPQKRLRYEMLSLVPLVVLIIALFLIFPYNTIFGETNPQKTHSDATCVYVELTDEMRNEVKEKILSSLTKHDDGDAYNLRANLSISTIPERPHAEIIEFKDRKSPKTEVSPSFGVFTSIPVTVEAADPVELPPSDEPEPKDVFSKEEMLKIID